MNQAKQIQLLDQIKAELDQLLDAAQELEQTIGEAEDSLLSDDYAEEDGPKGLELVSAEACELATGTGITIRQLLASFDYEVQA